MSNPASALNSRRALWLALAAAALALVCALSLVVGARPVTLGTVWQALTQYDSGTTDQRIIVELRLPRTLLGLLVGAALGLAGTMMQGATRNPLADPGILGVHSGAALFVVVGISAFGISTLNGYIWLAFAGAAASTVVVYSVASLGRDGATPVKLALAGAAVTAALTSITSAVLLSSAKTVDEFRFWQVGSLAGRSLDVLMQVAPFLAAGIVLALLSGRMLDGLALGDDVAKGLGQNVKVSRGLAALGWVVLSGAATAAVGPIAFVGLTIPHMARALAGSTYRWVLPFSMLLAPILLLGSDIVGRIVAPPGELQVGIVTAAIGAPFFIALVRRQKLAEL